MVAAPSKRCGREQETNSTIHATQDNVSRVARRLTAQTKYINFAISPSSLCIKADEKLFGIQVSKQVSKRAH